MNKKLVFILAMVLCIAFSFDTYAQTAKKGSKSKSSSSSKKGKSKKGSGSSSTTTNSSEPTTETSTTSQPVADMSNEPAEDTGVSTPDGLVAAEDTFNFASVELDTSKPFDGFMKLSLLKGAKPFPFPKEDMNTVKPFKRIWREINVADSENRIFAIPGETLIEFIMKGIKAGKLVAYEDDGFKKKKSYAKIMKEFRDSSILNITDTTTGEVIGSKTVANEFNPDSVTRYEIKEDIYFDKVRGRVVTSIIAIGPVKKNKASNGQDIGDSHPFYLDFRHCRNLLAAREVIDPQRDIYNISFDDIFLQRAFKSTIVKESNPANARIKDKYPDPARQKKESDRIERQIQQYKRNLWKF